MKKFGLSRKAGIFALMCAIAFAGEADIEVVVKKNCEDIAKLKTAVAKIIKDLKREKERAVAKTKSGAVKWEAKQVPHMRSNKKTCKKVRVIKIDEEQIKHSFVKFRKPKKFKVFYKKIKIYNLPALKGTYVVGYMKKGDEFMADMFTYPGWVHVPKKGWVRGFKLKPQVLYNPEKVGLDKSRSAYYIEEKEICE